MRSLFKNLFRRLAPGSAIFACLGAVAAAQSTNLVWPAPPDAPRITFVRTIAQPANAGARQSRFRRFANWVSGATQGNETFAKPFGVAVDDAGNLCLTDTGANAVSFFDERRKQWHRWEQIGNLRFSSPVAVVKQGKTLFVADAGLAAVIAFDTDGKLLFRIDHDLERPSGLAVRDGKLWVTDVQQHCVATFDLNGKFISRFGTRGVAPGEFNFPTHLAFDHDGRLYVTDSMNNRVQVFDAAGHFQSQIGSVGDGPGYFSRPKGVAVDSFGHVYVVDALFNNVQIFDRTGRLLLDWGGPGAAPGEFSLPAGIAINRDNHIFITDGYNRRIQEFKYVGKE